MPWNSSAITDQGIEMLQGSLGEKTLRVLGAAGGTGTVPDDALPAQTGLAGKKQDFTIVGMEDAAEGKKFCVRITNQGLTSGYKMTQLCLYACLEDGEEEEKVLAILQNEEGMEIPSFAEMPDFMMDFYVLVEYSRYANIQVTIDTSAAVSLQTMHEAIEAAVSNIHEITADEVDEMWDSLDEEGGNKA